MPKIVDHVLRRADLADAVLHLLAKDGIAGVTNRSVAAQAGCSTGSLAYYYPTRDELLRGALRRAAQLAGKSFATIKEECQGKPIEALQLLVEAVLPYSGEGLASIRIFLEFYASAGVDEEIRKEVASYLTNWRRLVARLIQQGMDMGLITSRLRAEQLASELVALVDGFSIHHVVAGDPETMDSQAIRTLARRWIASL